MNTEKFQQKLESEKTLLEGELSGIARLNPDTNTWEATAPEDADTTEFREEVADRLEEDESRLAMIEPLASRLQEVRAALDKIAAGTYGVCEVGGEQIEEARLEANPAAKTCTAHMEDTQN